jgi:chromosome segregation ATPase
MSDDAIDLSLSADDDSVSRQHLLGLIQQYRMENANLKAQFDEYAPIGAELEQLHTQNTKLSNQIRTLSLEKDDYAHRLDIALREVEDLKARLADEKTATARQLAAGHAQVEQRLEAVKTGSQRRIEALTQELAAAKAAQEQTYVNDSLLANQVNHLLEAAQRYFQTQVKNVEALTELLQQPPVVEPKVAVVEKAVPTGAKRIKKLKARVREREAELGRAEEELERAGQEIQELRVGVKQQEALRERIALLSEEKVEAEIRQKAKIAGLEDTIAGLKTELAQAREAKKVEPVPVPPPTPSVTLPSSRERELQATNDRLAGEVSALTAQLKSSEDRAREAIEKARAAQTETRKAQAEVERQRNEVNSLKFLHQAAVDELKTLHSSIPAKQNTRSETLQKKSDEKAQVSRLQKENEALKHQIIGLETTVNKKTRANDDSQRRIRELEANVAAAEERIEKLQTELRDVGAQLQTKPQVTVSTAVPSDIFRGPEFEIPLSSQLDKIASNSSLQPASKVKNAYKAIASFYTEKVSAVEKELQKAQTDAEKIRDLINQFVVNLSIGVTGRAVSFEDLVFENAGPALLESLLKLRSSNDSAVRQCDALQQAVERLHSTFGPAEMTDSIAKIDFVRAQLEKAAAKAGARRAKLRVLKSNVAALQKSAAAANARISALEADLAARNDQEDETLTDLRGTVRSLKAENQSLSERLAREQSDRAGQAATISDEHETKVSSLVAEHRRVQRQLQQELSESQQNYETINQEYQATEVQLSRFRKLLQTERAARQRLERELAEVRQTSADDEKAARARFNTEKAQLEESFEGTVAELRAQCERHLESLQKLAGTITDRENRLAQARTTATQLTRDKQRAEDALRALTEQTERQKKLAETSARSRLLALEAEYRERTEALRAGFDAEKRALLALVAESFSAYFNLAEPIDDRALRRGLERTKAELTRLAAGEQELRRLLGAAEGQTAQDAVAQILLDTSNA